MSGNGNKIDWNKIKEIVCDWCLDLQTWFNHEVWRYSKIPMAIKVHPPYKHERQAFGIIQVWFPHTDSRRVLATDDGESRYSKPTEEELNAAAEIVAKGIETIPHPVQLHRANARKVNHGHAGLPGYLWFRFGPKELPEITE